MQVNIDIKWERKEGVLIAMPTGSIDSISAPELQRVLESGIDPEEQALILDCEQVSFISSAGIRIFLIFAREFKASGKQFGVCALSDPIRKVMALGRFDQLVAVYDSQKEALNAFKSS
ncbi:MAG: STAS domain-containing protein [Gemmatimonadetes bacterium]|nr:STAS domain-containing protein [Gemmatimonadota bacterium]